jgi:Mg2+ and Co2+ transporter CorA
LTISSYIINTRTIRPVNIISEAVKIREEMRRNVEEYLWIHANEIEDIFSLQDMFGLHPLTVEAVLHQNQPSKIEEYDKYIFAVIDGIVEEENLKDKIIGDNISKDKKLPSETIIEDDLYIYLEKRWIITINFHNHNLEENIKKNIRKIMQQQQQTTSSRMSSTTTTFSSGNTENFDNQRLKKVNLFLDLL